MTQIKLGDDPNKIKEEIQKKKAEEERWRVQREAEETEFNKYFKEGSTTVIKHNGKFCFKGDISHCGRDNIFHNAKEIRKRMLENGKPYGHMNCNDLPTFDDAADWEREEKQRIELYKEDLYSFNGDEIVIEDLVGDEEQKQIYCLDEDKEEEDEDT